jgi:ketosteroid isomerase-like protein
LELAWNQAELHHDVRAAEALLTPAFMRVDNRGRMMDKAAYLLEIAKQSVQPSRITNEDMKVQRYGETAIIVSTYRETGFENGKPFVVRGRFTDVWVRTEGKWQCASNQETLIH